MSDESNVVELDEWRGRARFNIVSGTEFSCVITSTKLEFQNYDWWSAASSVISLLAQGATIHPDVTEITLRVIPRPPLPPPEPPKPLAAVPGVGKPPWWRKILALFVQPDLRVER